MEQVCFKSPLTSQKEPSPFNTQYQFAWLPFTIGIRSSGGISVQNCSSASVECRFTSIISSPVVWIYEVRMRVILKNALWCYSQTVYQQPGHFLEWWIEMSGRRMPLSYTHAWHTVWCKACADLHRGSFATIWLTSLISPMTRTETTSSRRGASSRNGCGWDLDRVGAGRGMERSQNQPNHTNGQLPSPPHLQTPLRWSLNQASCVCLLNGIGLGELSGLVSINLKRRGDQWQRRHSIYVQNRG